MNDNIFLVSQMHIFRISIVEFVNSNISIKSIDQFGIYKAWFSLRQDRNIKNLVKIGITAQVDGLRDNVTK